MEPIKSGDFTLTACQCEAGRRNPRQRSQARCAESSPTGAPPLRPPQRTGRNAPARQRTPSQAEVGPRCLVARSIFAHWLTARRSRSSKVSIRHETPSCRFGKSRASVAVRSGSFDLRRFCRVFQLLDSDRHLQRGGYDIPRLCIASRG